jgi:site-specific DNA recombinase
VVEYPKETVAKGPSAGHGEAAEAIRDLMETVTMFRDPSAPRWCSRRDSRLAKRPAREKAYPNQVKGAWGKVVAGVRYIAKPTISEALFSYRRAA